MKLSLLPVLLASLGSSIGSTTPLAAQLSANPKAVDFGDRGHNENPTATVTIANSATTPITLREIKPSCSCIKVVPPTRPIAPGGSVEIQVSMGSGRALGSLDKYLEITATEGGVPPLRVPMRMLVFNGLVQEPRDLKFEGVVGGEPSTLYFDLHWGPPLRGPVALEVKDVKVIDVKSGPANRAPSPSFFTTRTIADGMSRRVEVTLLPSHPEGRVWANLEAKINGKLLVVPIAGEMFRHIKVSPTYFNFNRVSRDEPESFVEEAVLTSTDGRAFNVVSITPQCQPNPPVGWEIQLEDLDARDGRASARHTLRARVVIQENLVPGASLSGKAIVRTDHPEKPEITLPFFGFFAAPKK